MRHLDLLIELLKIHRHKNVLKENPQLEIEVTAIIQAQEEKITQLLEDLFLQILIIKKEHLHIHAKLLSNSCYHLKRGT